MPKKFNPNTELQSSGNFKTIGTMSGFPYSEVAILNTSVTPKENYLRYMQKLDYEWIPDCGCDMFDLFPEIIPDVVACSFSGGVDNLGVVWSPLENGLPAMVRPGNPLLKDIKAWKEVLKFPDVSSWDWEGYAAEYEKAGIFEAGRILRGNLWTGFFERMIALMDFENAAMALVTEPESVDEFMNRLAEHNIELIEHFAKYLRADSITLNDDWGAQRSPFFSEKINRELIAPALKRVVDRTHELGMTFTLHSCGNIVERVPIMIECGVDAWQMQMSANDMERALELAGDKIQLELVTELPPEATGEEAEVYLLNLLRRLNGQGYTYTFVGPDTRSSIYSAGRKAALELDDK